MASRKGKTTMAKLNRQRRLRERRLEMQAKKAARKQLRAQARLEQAADPLIQKKGGKKGRNVTSAAAALDPTIKLLNHP